VIAGNIRVRNSPIYVVLNMLLHGCGSGDFRTVNSAQSIGRSVPCDDDDGVASASIYNLGFIGTSASGHCMSSNRACACFMVNHLNFKQKDGRNTPCFSITYNSRPLLDFVQEIKIGAPPTSETSR